MDKNDGCFEMALVLAGSLSFLLGMVLNQANVPFVVTTGLSAVFFALVFLLFLYLEEIEKRQKKIITLLEKLAGSEAENSPPK